MEAIWGDSQWGKGDKKGVGGAERVGCVCLCVFVYVYRCMCAHNPKVLRAGSSKLHRKRGFSAQEELKEGIEVGGVSWEGCFKVCEEGGGT